MLSVNQAFLPDRDERRDLHEMLESTTPAIRLRWLKWCCKEASDGMVTTYVEKTDGSAKQVWCDAVTLFWGRKLTILRAGDKLAEMIKGRA